MKIVEVHPDSTASRLGFRSGDNLLTINGNRIKDHLDFLFHIAEERVSIQVEREGEILTFELTGGDRGNPGLELELFKPHLCGDNCVFCFVDQNPEGVRESLLVKDEDYRLSFLYGNYVTLDNLKEEDFRRIVEMRLSPLYISVHTTDPEKRRRMMRGRHSGGLRSQLERLLEGGIEVHTQIVLVPDYNDGAHLRDTVNDLAGYYPGVASVAVVPVGLTDHRDRLPELRRLESGEMQKVIAACEEWRDEFNDKLGSGFVYLADEFYLASGVPLPPVEWYEDFSQLENGIGMAAAFVNCFESRKDILHRDHCELTVLAFTGGMGGEMFRRHLLKELQDLDWLEFNLQECRNTFFGESVTVSGLLSAGSMVESLQNVDLSGVDALLLPPNCLNEDGLFLDDVSLDEFATRYPCRVTEGSYDIVTDLLTLTGETSSAEQAEN